MAETQPRSLYWLIYPLAVLLIVAPNMEFALSVYPWRLGEVTWRFGAFGLGTNVSVFPLVGLVFTAIAASILGHRAVLWAVVGASATVALVVLGGLALFVLDGIQLRGSVEQGGQKVFDTTAVKAVITCLMSVCILVSIVIGGVRFLRRPRAASSARAPVGVVVGATIK